MTLFQQADPGHAAVPAGDRGVDADEDEDRELSGTNLLSTKGIVACAELGLFAGGVAYPWGGVPQAITGCDLAPWQVAGSASSTATSAAVAAGRVTVARGLPFAGFSAAGATRPPRVRILGPRGESFTSPADRRGRRSREVVFAPVPSENRMYAFVRRPAAGRWRVVGLDGPIRGIRSARGLAEPKITAKVQPVKGAGSKRRLVYRIRPIPGQKVRFYDRADNIVKPIGRPTSRRRGAVVFTPGKSSGRSHTIEAVVTSGRFPRAVRTVARYRLPR